MGLIKPIKRSKKVETQRKQLIQEMEALRQKMVSEMKNNDSKKKFIDIMLGNNIDITFEKNKIKNVLLDRMASTMYHVIDSTLLIGRNSVNGELINLDFKKDNLHTINVKGDARGNFNIN